MRPFFESFLEGFTGAGMFLGPRKVERRPLLAPMKNIPGPVVEEVYLKLEEMFRARPDRNEERQKVEISREIERIMREAARTMR